MAFLLQRPKTGCFPSDADLHRLQIPLQQRYKAYVTAIVANETNGGTRIQKRGSCRGEPLRKKAFAFHPFDRRCDLSDRATENRRYVYLYTFDCRVESAGSPTSISR